MQHPEPATLHRWLLRLFQALVAVAGLVYSYDFGQVIGGPIVGVVLALNGAVFCSLVAGGLVDWLGQWRPAARPQPRGPSAT